MGFWIVAALISVLVGAVLARAIFRPRADGVSSAKFDLQVYRDQLREVDRDLERGVVSEEDAARARAEVSRRVLEADRAAQAEAGTETGSVPRARALVFAALGLTVAAAFGVYALIGAPGYPDLPLGTRISLVEEARAARPGQAEAEAQVPFRPAVQADPERARLVEQLRVVMQQRPDDPVGLDLLAQNEAALGNFGAARIAQAHLVEVLGAEANAEQVIDLAEMMVLAAGGYVSPEAEAALRRGLEMQPRNGTARYYVGLMFAQQGRPDLGFPIWRRLLDDSTPDAPWLEPILLQIEEVAYLAGQEIDLASLPQPRRAAPAPGGPGPTAEDVEAAGDMSAEDRMAMIENMVAGLADRLATEGGPAADWARLIGAYQVLGQTGAARAVYDEALGVFADRPGDLALIEEAGAPLEPAE